MALVGVELETLVFEPDTLTTPHNARMRSQCKNALTMLE